jgi:hypothetical protein
VSFWPWKIYHAHRDDVVPLLTFLGALGAASGILWQAATARKRHYEQTEADRRRRITESFSKAVEQLASDKLEVRLGGIYTLERISRESREDYWPVMETLTAFVREHTRWKERDAISAETLAQDQKSADTQQSEPATDIAAVLTVIVRGDGEDRDWRWRLDLTGSDLRGANLYRAHLEKTNLHRAHLEGAELMFVDLGEADLCGAHFEKAVGLTQDQINRASGDWLTMLPEGLTRPEHWKKLS